MSTTVTASLKIGQECFVISEDTIVEAAVSEIVISKPQTAEMLAKLESRPCPPEYDPSLVVKYRVSPKSDNIYLGGREFGCADEMTPIQQAFVAASMGRCDALRPAEMLYPSAYNAAQALMAHCNHRGFITFSSFRSEDEVASV